MIERIRTIYHDYPRKFWILVGVGFVDGIGGTLLFPYFSLYITHKFKVGMTEAGLLLAIFAVTGLIGSMIGGALTDKFGRKSIMVFGLVFSALSALSMGLVNDLGVFYGLAVIVGLFSNVGGPANQAMIADILPENKRATGFGVMRVVGNMTWIVGPTIGGFVANRSYLALFIIDTVFSLITAALVWRFVAETKPESTETEKADSIWVTLGGYFKVLKNKLYLAFIVVSMVMGVVYTQMYSTLSVFMRDERGIDPQGYGMLLSVSAVLVIFTQFWVTRKTEKLPPMTMMAFGTFFYMLGFTMFGFIHPLWLFMVAILIITVGEMIVVPTGQALVARFAPEDMRGRYMATYGLAWTIPQAIGPSAAGLIMDNFDPNWVWYLGGILCLVAILGFLLLTKHVPAAKAEEPESTAQPA
ncbi:MAG: MFS transporter [Anaerolineaceae bacterium]|nr:MFS transporter [Anaerolineaceae bacterium]